MFGSNSGNTSGFGGSSNQSSGLFLSNTPAAPPPQGNNFFGNSGATSQQQSTSLFGASSNTQPSGGLMGNGQNSQGFFNNNQSQPGTSTMFGGGQQQTGGFGSNPQSTGGSLFGSSPQQPASGGVFGGNTQPQSNSGGLFGGSAQPQSNSGGLFGSSAQPQSNSGGLFGGSTQPQSNSGGLFGASTQPQSNSGGLFGSTPQPQSTGGLFGSSTQQQSTGTSFGSAGGFGSNTTQQTSLFGQQSNTGTSFFGGAPQQSNTTSLGFLGNNGQMGSAMQAPQANFMNNTNISFNNGEKQEPYWYREMCAVQNAYGTGEKCKFQIMMYEVLQAAPDFRVAVNGAYHSADVGYAKKLKWEQLYQQTPWIDKRVWQEAEYSNPDPMNLIAAPIIGVKALHHRVKIQNDLVKFQLEMVTAHERDGNSWLKADMGGDLNDIIEQCRHENVRLRQRLIKVLGRLEALQCESMQKRRLDSELQFAARLERLQKRMDDPRGAKSQITQIATELDMEDYTDCKLNGRETSSREMAEQEQQALYSFLELQREGIQGLMDVLTRDIRDLQIIKNSFR